MINHRLEGEVILGILGRHDHVIAERQGEPAPRGDELWPDQQDCQIAVEPIDAVDSRRRVAGQQECFERLPRQHQFRRLGEGFLVNNGAAHLRTPACSHAT